MTLENILFVALAALTLYNNGVQAYIHFEAYPLFKSVGKNEFAQYLAEYEKRLTLPLLLPYGLTILSNVLLIFVHDQAIPLFGIIIALVINLAVALVTLVIATPVYNRFKQSGDAADFNRLMNINLLRLVLSTASSFVILVLLFSALSLLGSLPA